MNGKSERATTIAIVQICAAGALILAFFLPLISATSNGASKSASWIDGITATGSNWTSFWWADFITFGAVIALFCALLVLAQSGRAPALSLATAAGFAVTAIGAGYYLSQVNQASGLVALYGGSSIGASIDAGLGLWLLIGASVVGALVAVFDLFSPSYAPSAPVSDWQNQAPAPYPPMGAPMAGPMGAPAGLARGRLSYVESGHPTSLVVNAGDQILVGRNANARIQLSDPKVSRQHAMLVWSGSEWLVRNLGATNGTKILGIDGAPRPLEGELRVAFGQLLVGDVLITLFPVGS